MSLYGWLQLALFVGLLFAVAKPVGLYLVRVLEPEGRTWLDRPIRPVERLIYRLLRVDPKTEQDWPRYAMSLLVFSLAGMLFTYAVLRLQHLLPLNPQHFGPVRADLAFNTAASFTTNTNWQNYGGETTLSYFSQMVGLVFHNFVSAAAGHRRGRGPRPGHRPAFGQDHRQLLGRPRPDQPLSSSAHLDRLLALSDLAGDDPELQAVRPGRDGRERDGGLAGHARGRPDHRPGTRGLPGGHQDAGNERRRLLQRQRRPPLRESHAPVELHSDAVHLSHPQRPDLLPRPEGQEPEARLGRLERHGHSLSGRGARLLEGRKPPATPGCRPWASTRPGATWRARRSASASPARASSPPSRPRPRAARSTRCTIRSPRSAAWSRCSTSSSAKWSSAASARGSTGCSSSSSWPSSSPA